MCADVTAAEFTGHGSLTVFTDEHNYDLNLFCFYLNLTVYKTKEVKIGELKHMQ